MTTCLRIRSGVVLANLTDVGCARENNEDYYGYWEPESEEEFRLKGRLAIVADGMGGHNGGEQASRIAVEAVREVYQQSADGDPQQALLAGLQAAHERIRRYARDFNLPGMGTTCTAIALTDRFLHYAHVGDSRLYLIRDGVVTRLTRDHCYVTRLVEMGRLSVQDAESHPDRHVLTGALGADGPLEIECPENPLSFAEKDVFVLCTDGFWNLVNDKDLLQVVTTHAPSDACHTLVLMAKERGAPDNVTLQILKIEQSESS